MQDKKKKYDDLMSMEIAQNPEEKTLCVLLLDRSGSMGAKKDGVKAIDELNNGIKTFFKEISKNDDLSEKLEVSIVQFDHEVEPVLLPSLINEDIAAPTLVERGGTYIFEAIKESIAIIEARKDWYRDNAISYNRSVIVLITDGEDISGEYPDKMIETIKKGHADKEFHLIPIGVKDADFALLDKLSSDGKPALKLNEKSFSEFFVFLSNSFDKGEIDTSELPESLQSKSKSTSKNNSKSITKN